MAALPNLLPPSASLDNHRGRFHDSSAAAAAAVDPRPAGECSYRNLQLQHDAPQCGCQRFWPDPDARGASSQDSPWCMCGHHACFHRSHSPITLSSIPNGHDPVTPPAVTLHLSHPIPPSHRSPCHQFNNKNLSSHHSFASDGPGVTSVPNSDDNGLLWPTPDNPAGPAPRNDNSFRSDGRGSEPHSLASTSILPPVPPQCLMDSQTSNGAAFPLRAPSIDTPSQLGTPDLKVLRGVARTLKSVRGHCETLNRQLGRVHDPSPSSRPHSIHSLDRGLGRLDENAFFSDTPPFASTHHQTATLSPARAISNSPDALVSWLRQLLPRLDALTSHLTAYPTLLSSLHNHAKRLDVLENASFSNGPFEDVTERLELIDGRVTEAEGKLDDHEKWRAVIDEEGLVDHGRPERGPAGQLNLEPATRDQSFASHGSSLHGASAVSGASSALAATTMECTHLLARVATLETMVIDLQSAALPSVARPWHLEVVVLPWGRHLRNVWQPVNDPNQKQSTESDGNDAWTSSRSFTGMSANLTADKRAGWDGAAIRRWADGTNAWMSARAPGVKSAVFQRLRSRGLVQNVRIAGNSARDVRHAIETTFADTLKILRGELGSEAAESVSQDSEKAAREGCLGIWAPFIPLRKIHKDSRLQFLTRDEMSTSTLWTAEFLASSVVMKMSGQWRLYITHRQGYLQELGDDQTEWTWARLRQLTSRAAPDQVGADEEEEKCWKWDPRLDPSSSVESSFVSDLSHSTSLGQALPIASAMGGRTIHQAGSSRSPSPVVYPRTMPISPLSEFVSQPRRTVSVPLLSDTRVATLTPNHTRRVVSHETGPAPKLLIKRRRTSFSPSSTPKRLKSPSPFFSEITWGDARSQAAGASNVKRSGTPFAYATPHSGPVQMDHRETGDEGNSLVHAHTEEPTWEGVNDVDDDDDENEEEHEHEEEEEEKSSAGTSLQRGSA